MKVIGVGDNVVDKYNHTRIMYPGGNSLNFSVYAKELGMTAAYMGVFGNDLAGKHILRTLQELKIDISYSKQVTGENGYALVDLIDGDRVFLGWNGGGVQKSHPIQLKQEELFYLSSFDIVHTSIYSGIDQELYKVKELGVPLSYDFSNEFNETILESVCKFVDFSLLSCGQREIEEVKDLLLLVHSYGSELVIGTMGSRGALAYDGNQFYFQKPEYVTPVDTLGAGDAFFTAFILHYLTTKKIQKDFFTPVDLTPSLKLGAKFAAQKCLIDGAFGFGISF